MNKPRPSAVTLATGLTVSLAGALLALLGLFWVGLAVSAVGAWQAIAGVYRLAAAVDYLAARPVVRRSTVEAERAPQ